MDAVDELLKCAICLEWYKSPRRLPCQHVYCLECLQGLVETGTRYIRCPECRSYHALLTKSVEGFQSEGRLEQFIEKLTKLTPDSDEENNPDLTLVRCDHSEPSCRQCKTIHKVMIVQSFLHRSGLVHTDFFEDSQLMKRRIRKTELNKQHTHLEHLKMRVIAEIKDMITELEKRQQILLSDIAARQELILDSLSKLEQADIICAQYSALMTDAVDNVSHTNNFDALGELISEHKAAMNSLDDLDQNKGITNVHFNREKMMAMIETYGLVSIDIDYKKEFTMLTTIDGRESSDAETCRFYYPWGLTVCPFTENVYVTDCTSIRVYSSDGLFISNDVTNDLNEDWPLGLAIDSNQRLIVTSFSNNYVKIYRNRGLIHVEYVLVNIFGSCGTGIGEFSAPRGVACDRYNNIYVVDRNNKRIQVFTPNGTFLSVIGRDILQLPCCVQINKRQEILVTDSQLGQVLIFNIGGTLIKSISEGGNIQLKEPVGICLDQNGRILVADQANAVIQVYNDDGSHHCTISEPAAAMTSLCGLAVTKSGTIFIIESASNKLHRIAPIDL